MIVKLKRALFLGGRRYRAGQQMIADRHADELPSDAEVIVGPGESLGPVAPSEPADSRRLLRPDDDELAHAQIREAVRQIDQSDPTNLTARGQIKTVVLAAYLDWEPTRSEVNDALLGPAV